MKTKIILFFWLVTTVLAGHAQQMQDAASKNKAAAIKIITAFDKGDVNAFDALIARDVKSHSEMPPGMKSTGLDAVKEMCKMNKTAFPDMTSRVHTVATAGDTVIVFYTSEGTNTGSLYGQPATNKKISVDGVDIMRFQNGKAVEHWGVFDTMKMMMQLGMMGQGSAPQDKEQ